MTDFPAWTALLLATKTSLVLGLAFLCTRHLSRSRARARHRVWVSALGMALLIPVGLLIPGIELSVLPPVGIFAEPSQVDVDSGVVSTAPVPQEAMIHPGHAFSIAWIGVIVYVSGVILVLFPLLLGMLRASFLSRRATPATMHPLWQRTLQETVDRVQADASVLVSDSIHVPFTFGLVHPTILLPENVSTWTAAHRRNAMIHEFEHVTRRDWVSQLVGALACAVYWFHPLVWFAARRLHLEAERSCDERVLQLGSDPRDYAQQLVDLTRQYRRYPLQAAVSMASGSELADRVTSVLQTGRIPMESRRLTIVLAILIIGSGVAMAPVVPAHATRQDRSDRAWDRSTATTPLMRAARDGDLGQVRDLVQHGADVNATAGDRFTALILASTNGHTSVVRALLDAGADVNQSVQGNWQDDLQRTALGAAARGGHRSVAEALVAAGAEVDGHGRGDATPLMEACAREHHAIAKLLIEHGADVNLQIRGDGNAVIAAARGGSLKTMKLLVESGADVNVGVAGDGNALIMAVRNGDRALVEYLLELGADPNAYVPGDESAMVAAAESGDRRMMQLLLAASKDN